MWEYNLGLMFSSIAENNAKRPAIEIGNDIATYQDIELLSNKIARFLLAEGFNSGDRIGLTSHKSIEIFALIVACWKLGVAYFFFDRFSPQYRLDRMLEICQPKLVIYKVSNNASIITDKYRSVELDNVKIKASSYIDSKLDHYIYNVSANAIAYIMFTSGSTGVPKGVAVSHQNVINFTKWAINEYSITVGDKFTNINSLFFDNSVFDIYTSLLSGACLLPISRKNLKDPTKLIQYVNKKKASIWFSVPSFLIYILNLHVFDQVELTTIKKIIFGGEGFPKNKLKELYNLFHGSIELFNVYGPTECTCICSSYKINEIDFENKRMDQLAPLGSIISNVDYYILNNEGKKVELGEKGELYLGGTHVALGYFNNPLKTSEQFIQNPLHNDYRDIVYRTGDIVKQDKATKQLHFLCRKDDQVKFMGYRIELGEIEAALASISGIDEFAVVFGKKNTYDEITCFLKSEKEVKEIKQDLSMVLPNYMMPRKFIYRKALPKNANGKIDRKLLSREYYDSK